MATKCSNEWIAPVGKLTNLKTLRFTNNGTLTDAGAPHLAKLTKLKNLKIGTAKATPQALLHLAKLPLESLQQGEGFDSIECIPLIQGLNTLRRLTLTLTNAKALTDADLKVLASITPLEHTELEKIELPGERIQVLQDFVLFKIDTLRSREWSPCAGEPDGDQGFAAESGADLSLIALPSGGAVSRNVR